MRKVSYFCPECKLKHEVSIDDAKISRESKPPYRVSLPHTFVGADEEALTTLWLDAGFCLKGVEVTRLGKDGSKVKGPVEGLMAKESVEGMVTVLMGEIERLEKENADFRAKFEATMKPMKKIKGQDAELSEKIDRLDEAFRTWEQNTTIKHLDEAYRAWEQNMTKKKRF